MQQKKDTKTKSGLSNVSPLRLSHKQQCLCQTNLRLQFYSDSEFSGPASLPQRASIILMMRRQLHYSQRSSSAVRINYHRTSINESFQTVPLRMPLIWTSFSLWRPTVRYCTTARTLWRWKNPLPCGELQLWLTLTTAAQGWISPTLHTLHLFPAQPQTP